MYSKLFLVVIILFLVTVQIYAQDEMSSVKWSLNVEGPLKSLNKGDKFRAVLRAEIEKGWHLYAMEKIEGGPMPTRISVPDGLPFALGKIEAPEPIDDDDSAFGAPTKFYENAVKFDLAIKVLDDFEKGSSGLRIKVRFQICSKEMCLPPRTVIVDSTTDFPKERIEGVRANSLGAQASLPAGVPATAD